MSATIKKSDLLNIFWLILLVGAFCFPRMFSGIKAMICAGILLLAFLGRKIKLSNVSISFLGLWLAYAILTLFIGFIYSNSGAGCIDFFRLNIVYYVLLVLIASIIENNPGGFSATKSAVFYSSLYIFIYNIFIVLFYLAHIPLSGIFALDTTANIAFHSGYIHITSTNISMLMILFPINIYLYLIDRKDGKKINKFLVGSFATAATMFICGRRILWITMAFILVFVLMWGKLTNKRIIYNSVLLVCFILVIFMAVKYIDAFSFKGMLHRLQDAFSSTESDGETNVRFEQMEKLLEGFTKRPVFGNGAAAVIDGYSRNTNPWVFEMSYYVVLFQSGIVGSILFATSLLYIGYKAFVWRNRNCLLAGMAFGVWSVAVISNATNPYFSSSFDFVFFLILPLYFIDNIKLLDKE